MYWTCHARIKIQRCSIQGGEIQSQALLSLGLMIPATWSAEIGTPHPTAYTLGYIPERRRKDPFMHTGSKASK